MLAACEMSGRVREAFAARGWDAWSCDTEPSEIPGQHIQADIREVFAWGIPGTGAVEWDLIIAFPPCTDLSQAGAVWWKAKQADGRQQAAAEFFMEMVGAPARHVAVENPRGIMTKLYRPPDQVIEPFMFGEPYAKKTCLWLKNLPLLEPDDPVVPTGRVATGGGSWRTDTSASRRAMNAYEDSEGRANRSKVRSRTFSGIARAMAAQWGAHVASDCAPAVLGGE